MQTWRRNGVLMGKTTSPLRFSRVNMELGANDSNSVAENDMQNPRGDERDFHGDGRQPQPLSVEIRSHNAMCRRVRIGKYPRIAQRIGQANSRRPSNGMAFASHDAHLVSENYVMIQPIKRFAIQRRHSAIQLPLSYLFE